MQPIGCGYYPPGDSVKKFSAFKGLEERHRCKILVPLGLPRRILSAKGLRAFSVRLRSGSTECEASPHLNSANAISFGPRLCDAFSRTLYKCAPMGVNYLQTEQRIFQCPNG